MNLNKLKTFGMAVLTVILVGCNHIDRPNDPSYAPVIPEMKAELTPDMGSVYHPGRGLSLYEDITAHEVGDLITVVFTERMDASKEAETNFDKSNNANIVDPTLLSTAADFGLPKWLPIPLSTTDNLNLETNISADREFEGTSDSEQRNSLTGQVTVMVTQVYPNGNLYVRGEKWININHGDEFVRVSGIIRPEDIQSNNTIESHRIADARISYSGRGALTNATKPGWLMKIITSSLWPL